MLVHINTLTNVQANVDEAKADLKVFMSHRGYQAMKNMIRSMLHTQIFDDIVDQYNGLCESRSHEDEAGENSSFKQVNFQFVSGW